MEWGAARRDYTVAWDGRNGSGRNAAAGVYIHRLQAGSFADTKKMLLIR
jgi:hypothetical protein